MDDGLLDVVRRNSDAFSNRDVDGMMACYAPDATVVDRRPVGWSEFRGHDQLRAYYQGIFDNVTSLGEELVVVAERDGVLVADCTAIATVASDSGEAKVAFDYALAMRFRDGVIAEMEIHADTEAALAAAGLA